MVRHGVTIVAQLHLSSELAHDASQMYSRNVFTLLDHLLENGELALDFEDEITSGACVTRKEEVPA